MKRNDQNDLAVRPVSVEPAIDQEQLLGCCRQQKIDTAMGIVSMFMEITKPLVLSPNPEDPSSVVRCQLTGKEVGAYHAALDWLERYLDAPDTGPVTDCVPPL